MNPEWHKDFFTGIALDLWEASCSDEQTVGECGVITDLLDLKQGDKLLDVACGPGRHAVELASHGIDVTGFDFSAEALERAKARAKGRGARVTWCRGDVRELPFRNEFKAAICLGNSFGYHDAEGTQAFFKGIGDSLEAKGWLVLETAVAAEALLPDLDERNWAWVGDILLLVENDYVASESVVRARYTFSRGLEREVRTALYHVYTVGEITRMLRRYGLVVEGLYGSYALEPFEVTSPNLLMVARRM